MKHASALGLFTSIIMLSSCAPVASSSPKLRTERSDGSGVVANGRIDGRIDSDVVATGIIVSTDEYSKYSENLKDYKTKDILTDAVEIIAFRSGNKIDMMDLNAELKRTEVKIIFFVDLPAHKIGSDNVVNVKVERDQKEINLFSIEIDRDVTSEKSWAMIVKKLSRVTVAHRTVVKK